MAASRRLERFGFREGDRLGDKYETIEKLGSGWEGEVYLVRERATGIERAAKFFFPHRNPRDRVARNFARKLWRMRYCPMVTQYLSRETLDVQGFRVTYLVSDYVAGPLLSRFIRKQPGGRLTPFQAMHLLHALATGVEAIHATGEYHGDLHWDNIIVQRYGFNFDLKLLDVFTRPGPRRDNVQEDVVDLVRILYDCVGGPTRYARQPPEIKEIVCGLKRSLILKKFRNAGQLRSHLEAIEWS